MGRNEDEAIYEENTASTTRSIMSLRLLSSLTPQTNHWLSLCIAVFVLISIVQLETASTATALVYKQRRLVSKLQHQPSSVLRQLHHVWANSSRSHPSVPQNKIPVLRGGAETSTATSTTLSTKRAGTSCNDDNVASSSSALTKKRGMTIALASSYFTVMGAKCALPSVLSLIVAPTTGLTFPPGSILPQQMMARQLTIATLSVALGKLVLGPAIDHFGGKVSLQFALSFLCVALLVISLCQSFAVFGVAWIMVDFIFSACWPACINTIHQYFDESDWPNQIGNLAAAARAGNSLAFIVFATIITFAERLGTIKQCWRPVFFVAACSQVIPVLLLSIYGGSDYHQSSNTIATSYSSTTTVRSSLDTLRREAMTLDFWLHLINRSMLMIYASFLLFVPTLMTQVYKTTTGIGAQVGSIYALGCLLAVSALSKSFARMCQRTKLWCISLLLLVGASGSSLCQLAHVSGYIHLSPLIGAILFFVWGFSFAIPFYIPPSLYALSRGGQESSATITDIFDIGGFGLLAMFNGYVASIRHHQPTAWIPTFIITTSCSLISFAALFIVTWREGKNSSRSI
jgi:MFS family permease